MDESCKPLEIWQNGMGPEYIPVYNIEIISTSRPFTYLSRVYSNPTDFRSCLEEFVKSLCSPLIGRVIPKEEVDKILNRPQPYIPYKFDEDFRLIIKKYALSKVSVF